MFRIQLEMETARPKVFEIKIDAQSVFEVVEQYGRRIKIAPHDLRRTFAKLAHSGYLTPTNERSGNPK